MGELERFLLGSPRARAWTLRKGPAEGPSTTSGNKMPRSELDFVSCASAHALRKRERAIRVGAKA